MLTQHQIEQLLLPQLEQLEEERATLHQTTTDRSNRVYALLILFMLVTFGGIFFNLFWLRDPLGCFVLYSTIVLFGLIVLFLYWQAKTEIKNLRNGFRKRTKKTVYKTIFETWNATIQYTPQHCIEEDEFAKAKLFSNFNAYQGNDYCTGVLEDGRRFEFSDLNVQQTNTAGNTVLPVFKGLFFSLEHSLPYQGFQHPEKVLQLTPKKRPLTKKEEAPMPIPSPITTRPSRHNEDILDADIELTLYAPKEEEALPLFDQCYELTPDSPYVRANLSNEFCDKLVQLRLQEHHNIALSFTDNKVYLTCKQHADCWPVNIHLPMNAVVNVRHLVLNFWTAFHLLEVLAAITHSDRA